MLCIWSSSTAKLIIKLNTSVHFTNGGVLAVAFSSDGSKVACVGGNLSDSTILVYDWQKNDLLAKGKAHNQPTFFLSFNPVSGIIAMGGKSASKFFNVEGKIVSAKTSVMGNVGTQQTMYCCAFDSKGNTYIGTKEGSIYVFVDNKCVDAVKAHQGALMTIYRTEDGFITGGKDAKLIYWKYDSPKGGKFKKVNEVQFTSGVRSVVPSIKEDGVCYAMLDNGDFFKVDNFRDSASPTHVLMLSHSGEKSQLWGLDTHPTDTKIFISGGDDGRVIVWDSDNRKFVNSAKVPQPGKVRSVAISPDGKQVAVGTFEGNVYVYDESILAPNNFDVQPIVQKPVGKKEEIAVLKYSPDGKWLAVGSHDNFMYVVCNLFLTIIATY
jgi:microtubule-associated protein-like 6